MADIYNTSLWADVRASVIARDHGTCSVARLIGGTCSAGPLHVHHLTPLSDGGDPYDEDNCLTSCARHHPQVEALRRYVLARREPRPVRCYHLHRTREAREQCERRLAARNGRELVAA